MRNYIFEFDQEIVLRLGLKLNELLFLDYVAKFINSVNNAFLSAVRKKDDNHKTAASE